MISLIFGKLRKFRMTVPSLVLLVFASIRTLTSGDSIQLVGICAAVVPFICQFRNFQIEENVDPIKDVLSSYFMNLILMCVYFGWVFLLTWVGKTFVPSYVVNPCFGQMAWIALCADVVFISALIPICRELEPMHRLIPGLVLTNAMLVFMMLASTLVGAAEPANIPQMACGFTALILVLTLGMIFGAYGQRKK